MGKFIYTVFALVLFSLLSCTKHGIDKDIHNAWHYKNQLQDYSEIWFGTNNVALLVDETGYRIQLLNYKERNDTLFFSQLGLDSFDEFWIIFEKKITGKYQIIIADGQKFDLYKIDGYNNIRIDTSKVSINQNFNIFKQRAITFQKELEN